MVLGHETPGSGVVCTDLLILRVLIFRNHHQPPSGVSAPVLLTRGTSNEASRNQWSAGGGGAGRPQNTNFILDCFHEAGRAQFFCFGEFCHSKNCKTKLVGWDLPHLCVRGAEPHHRSFFGTRALGSPSCLARRSITRRFKP